MHDKNPSPAGSPPTLKEIAQAVGVSTMTVSRALRGTGRMSDATREKVLATAQQMGYRPNPLVQTLMASLRNKRVEREANIAWVTTHPKSDPWPESVQMVCAGSQERARELGFHLDIFPIGAPKLNTQAIRRILQARGIRAVVVGPLKEPGEIPEFPWADFPVAAIGRSLIRPQLHYVMGHHYHSMQNTLDELTRRGFQRIGLIVDSPLWEVRADHASAMVFQHHCYNQKIDPAKAYPDCTNWTNRDYQKWFSDFKPDAIVAEYGNRFKALHDAGLPMRDIAFTVLSWNDAYPKLSGIKQPFHRIGAAAIDMVVAQIHRNERGIPKFPKAMLMEGEWFEGTTLPARAES